MPIQFLSVAGDCRVRHGNDIVVFTAMTAETYWSSHYGLFLRINYFAFELSVPFACAGSSSIALFLTETTLRSLEPASFALVLFP